LQRFRAAISKRLCSRDGSSAHPDSCCSTRGLDVNAKTEILRLVNGLADAGTAVLLVSSELEELTRVCDRYLVMVRGRIMAELPAGATREQLVNALSLTTRQDVAA
jgi:ABC-type multidrug transport system ATPase subunit